MIRNTYIFRPLRNSHFLTVMLYEYVCSLIIGLRSVVSPNTVFWGVPETIIFSLNRHFFRGFAHIQNEQSVAIPSAAHLNSSRPIILIRRSVNIITPLSHSFPYFMCSGARHTVSTIMKLPRFFLKASTAFNFTTKITGLNINRAAAITNTPPVDSLSFANLLMKIGLKYQSPYANSGLIYKFSHKPEFML